MRWEAWMLCGLYVGSFFAQVYSIGKPRAPLTPSVLARSGPVILGLIWLVVRLGMK